MLLILILTATFCLIFSAFEDWLEDKRMDEYRAKFRRAGDGGVPSDCLQNPPSGAAEKTNLPNGPADRKV